MNSYGQPSGPEIAMLDEMHRLWDRTFGQPAEAAPPRTGRPVLFILLTAAVAVGAVVVRVTVF